jgi:hypothetical protein
MTDENEPVNVHYIGFPMLLIEQQLTSSTLAKTAMYWTIRFAIVIIMREWLLKPRWPSYFDHQVGWFWIDVICFVGLNLAFQIFAFGTVRKLLVTTACTRRSLKQFVVDLAQTILWFGIFLDLMSEPTYPLPLVPIAAKLWFVLITCFLLEAYMKLGSIEELKPPLYEEENDAA